MEKQPFGMSTIEFCEDDEASIDDDAAVKATDELITMFEEESKSVEELCAESSEDANTDELDEAPIRNTELDSAADS